MPRFSDLAVNHSTTFCAFPSIVILSAHRSLHHWESGLYIAATIRSARFIIISLIHNRDPRTHHNLTILPNMSKQEFVILGAGVLGLTTALELHGRHPGCEITIVAKFVPGDRSVEYCSPWAGANWCSMVCSSTVPLITIRIYCTHSTHFLLSGSGHLWLPCSRLTRIF